MGIILSPCKGPFVYMKRMDHVYLQYYSRSLESCLLLVEGLGYLSTFYLFSMPSNAAVFRFQRHGEQQAHVTYDLMPQVLQCTGLLTCCKCSSATISTSYQVPHLLVCLLGSIKKIYKEYKIKQKN